MTVTKEQIQLFSDFIDSYDYFFVTGHKEPDGDSIASVLGIGAILEHKNKKFKLISVGPFKRSEIKKYEQLFSCELDKTNVLGKKVGLIIVDCSEHERVGSEICDELKIYPYFVIDHHKTSDASHKNSIIYPESPACAYLVLQLYEALIGKPSEKLANDIFFGICTDTGFFRFLNSDSAPVFQAVSRLVECGANPRLTYNEINSGKPFSTRKLLGKMLENATQYFDGKLIVTYETLEDTKKFGKNGRDTDLLYSSLLAVEGCQAVLFVRQDTEKTCTVGFRSKDEIDVSKIAAVFGGGGHKNAAGLSTTGKISTLTKKILKEFEKIF